jgi:hypothetical protein
MTDRYYNEIPAVRRSDLWEIRKSPAHFKYKVDHPEPPTAALTFGTAAHKFILEPDLFWKEYTLAPEVDRRTKAGKETWSKFLEDLGDMEPITVTDYGTILQMNDAIEANPEAAALLKTGNHEVTFTWKDPATGIECKIRPDVLTEYEGKKYIVDYKTTTSCEPGAFERSCRIYGYKLQAGMYSAGVFAETMDDYGFAFVAQEKKPPYAVRVYFCDPGFVEEGDDLFHELLELYADCCRNDSWPGYESGVLCGDK